MKDTRHYSAKAESETCLKNVKLSRCQLSGLHINVSPLSGEYLTTFFYDLRDRIPSGIWNEANLFSERKKKRASLFLTAEGAHFLSNATLGFEVRSKGMLSIICPERTLCLSFEVLNRSATITGSSWPQLSYSLHYRLLLLSCSSFSCE